MKNFSLEQIKAVQDLYEVLQNDSLKERQYDKSKVEEGRSEYARDYARILYSSSFRRLQGKMQILGIESTAFYRNRLTHSLEVSQIARSIARTLAIKCNEKGMYSEEELYLLDAAALGHDIGHPAFGHKGERVLDEIAKVYELRFEGNAQNFRVLRKLDRHGSSPDGLHLTYRTLLAINKYIEKEGKETKKFMYNEDYKYLDEFRNENNLINQRTLDVQIIELADDIAYAVHDLEDGLSQGLFSIDELCFEILSYKNEKFNNEQINQAYNTFTEITNTIRKELNNDDKIKTIQEYSHLFRKNLTSRLTNEFVINLSFNEKEGELCIEEPYGALCKILSKIIFICVSRNSEVALYETKGEIVLKTLFNIYVDEKINKNYYLLPPDYRPENDEIKTIVRCVLDYLAGMMDTYAISEYERLTSKSFYNMNINNIPEIKKIN